MDNSIRLRKPRIAPRRDRYGTMRWHLVDHNGTARVDAMTPTPLMRLVHTLGGKAVGLPLL